MHNSPIPVIMYVKDYEHTTQVFFAGCTYPHCKTCKLQSFLQRVSLSAIEIGNPCGVTVHRHSWHY